MVSSPRPRTLSIGHFRRIASRGFGDPHNSYAYGYAWYDDHVYIGTNRDVLVLAKTRFRFQVPTSVWPVEVPAEQAPEEAGGQIWRYSHERDTWQCVYRSLVVKGVEGRDVPLATGFRNMVVFQGRSDDRPALYTIPSCGSLGLGPVMLRSIDGVHFEQISEQGMGLGDPNLTAFRSLVVHKGRLYITPTGSRGGDPNVSYHAAILASDDPVRGRWERVNIGSFGEPTNLGIYDMVSTGEFLYAGTMNIREGCQLWKTDAEGTLPYRWTKVFDRGADRGPFNQGVVSITTFGEAVYLGTGIQNGGYDRVNNIGPDAGEVIRVFPDDSWELVVGSPRITRQGLKVPASGYGPGFDNRFAGYMWRMCEHEGALYVGTYDSSAMFPFSEMDERTRRVFDEATLDLFMRRQGGCELWSSADGDNWSCVTRNGFDNPYNWGIRTLLSTPRGLVVGTANPFGPKVAVRGATGWRYEPNAQGGIEVWHGAWEHAGLRERTCDSPGPGDVVPSTLDETTMSWVADDSPTPGELALRWPDLDLPAIAAQADVVDGGDVSGTLSAIRSDVLSRGYGLEILRHTARDVETRREAEFRATPASDLLAEQPDLLGPREQLELEVEDYFAGTRMRSAGYWRPGVQSPAAACQALVDELIALWPADDDSNARRVVVCGASAAAIAEAISIRRPCDSIRAAPTPSAATGRTNDRRRWWKRPFRSAKNLAYEGHEPLDIVVWHEVSSDADNRRAALAGAYRALRPGGVLIAAELLGIPRAELGTVREVPPLVGAVDRYRDDVQAAGFVDARFVDIGNRGWRAFQRHSTRHFLIRLLLGQIDRARFDAILAALPGGGLLVEAHELMYARKPDVPISASKDSPHAE